jgi:phosphopantothenoylcysteine decarboxylase/phosphopantothenate--cysteine ligase
MRRSVGDGIHNGQGDPLAGRTVALGVTGGIAAYKAAALASGLVKRGVHVHVVMTANATKLVGPATFRALTGNPVYTEMFVDAPLSSYPHLDLGREADAVVVAPATANIMAKFAHGIADDVLSTLFVSTKAPVLIAPAMNTTMWEHASTQANLAILLERGCEFAEPGEGRLACGDEGVGRMAEPEEIIDALVQLVARGRDMAGLRVVVTAGPTREAIDPVRFISNRSSGKQGYAIAAEAARRGAEVILISGPTALAVPPAVRLAPVTTASEMAEAALAEFEKCDVFIGCAAVADFVPLDVQGGKIKKGDGELVLRLAPARDVLAELAERKRAQFVVGFAAETENLIDNARAKIAAKKLDLIVANDVSVEGIGFESDRNAVTLIGPDGIVSEFGPATKQAVASHILDAVLKLRR